MYIYESHLGRGLYTSYDYLDYDDLYCETCGDSDQFVGKADTRAEAWELLKGDTNINGCGGWDYDYVQRFIKVNWDE